MAKLFCCLWTTLLFSIVSATISKKSSEHQIHNELTNGCKKRCEGSYPQHTYPKREPLEACLRGCRLSVIRQLSSQDRKQENVTRSCVKGCQEGYDIKDSLYACKVGCQEQKMLPSPKSLLEREDNVLNSWQGGPYFMFYPVFHARYYCHGFLSRASYYIQSSTVYYFSSWGDQTLVVRIQDPPHVFMSNVPDRSEPLRTTIEQETLELNQKDDSSGYTWKVVSHGHNWLKCVSKRSGMPVWVVFATLLLSSVFLLWLCCASTDTAPKHHEKELLLDDLLFLDEPLQLKKKPLVKCDESEDAEPLPMKVDIDATLI